VIHPRSSRRVSIALAVAVTAWCVAIAPAQSLPSLAFDPAPNPNLLRLDLAETVRGATLWLLEEDDDTVVTVWVWPTPGDPDPVGLFDGNPWAEGSELMRRDLGEAMRATVEFFGPYFEGVDPGWSERALALAERLGGTEQTVQMYTLIVGDDAIYGVQISDAYIDIAALEVLDGTWVQVTLLQE